MNQILEPTKEEVNKILKLFEKRSFEELNITLKEIVNRYPRGSTAWLFLGMHLGQINRLDEAEKALYSLNKWIHFFTDLMKISFMLGIISSKPTVSTWLDKFFMI